MASPFRLNKKTRGRDRTFAKRLANEETLAKWDEATANSIRRVADLLLKQANAKRGKKRPKNPRQPTVGKNQ